MSYHSNLALELREMTERPALHTPRLALIAHSARVLADGGEAIRGTTAVLTVDRDHSRDMSFGAFCDMLDALDDDTYEVRVRVNRLPGTTKGVRGIVVGMHRRPAVEMVEAIRESEGCEDSAEDEANEAHAAAVQWAPC